MQLNFLQQSFETKSEKMAIVKSRDNICGRKRCYALTLWPHFEAVIPELKC